MEDLTSELIRRFLKNSTPILTGLSATYLYSAKREFGRDSIPDDVRGSPVGHFVVLCGYDQSNRTVLVMGAHVAADIRVIISAYQTEKMSDDHPYIWRYTARRAW